MDTTKALLIVGTLLCSLVAGFLFAFATVVMPGLGKMEDGDFLRAFQLIDGVIQDNQPLFLLVWAGSMAAMLIIAVVGFGPLTGVDRGLLVGALLFYFGGVQLPTFAINIPLNNQLKLLEIEAMDPAQRRMSREGFERRWNRWNSIRTAFASLAATLMMILLVRL